MSTMVPHAPDRKAPDAPALAYDRHVLVNVLVYHWPTATSGCWCGWAVLGASFPEHVADVYEECIAVRVGSMVAQCGSTEVHEAHWCAGLDGTEVGR